MSHAPCEVKCVAVRAAMVIERRRVLVASRVEGRARPVPVPPVVEPRPSVPIVLTGPTGSPHRAASKAGTSTRHEVTARLEGRTRSWLDERPAARIAVADASGKSPRPLQLRCTCPVEWCRWRCRLGCAEFGQGQGRTDRPVFASHPGQDERRSAATAGGGLEGAAGTKRRRGSTIRRHPGRRGFVTAGSVVRLAGALDHGYVRRKYRPPATGRLRSCPTDRGELVINRWAPVGVLEDPRHRRRGEDPADAHAGRRPAPVVSRRTSGDRSYARAPSPQLFEARASRPSTIFR